MPDDLRSLVDPGYDLTKYMQRLIVEAPYIMARLHNPGGSILLMPTSNPDQVSYGTHIGNDAHLDLIETGMILGTDFSKGEREDIYKWAMGFTSSQAAELIGIKSAAVRKRRQRLIAKLEMRLSGGTVVRGTRDGDTEVGGEETRIKSQEDGRAGRAETETRGQEGDSIEQIRKEERP